MILRKFPFLPITADFQNLTGLNLNPVPNVAFPSRELWERGVVDMVAGTSFYTDGFKLDNQVGSGGFQTRGKESNHNKKNIYIYGQPGGFEISHVS